ncbi:hypothetical protein LINPERHAP2_LOCUS25484 [Linum perenne]
MSISTITKSNSEIQKDRDCGNLVKIFPPFKSQQQQKESIFCYITHHQHGPPPRSQSYSIDEHTAKPAVYLTVNSGFLLQSRSHPSLHPGIMERLYDSDNDDDFDTDSDDEKCMLLLLHMET